MSGSADLKFEFEVITHWSGDDQDLYVRMFIRNANTIDLSAEFKVYVLFSGYPQDLLSIFIVRHPGSVPGPICEFVSRQSGSRTLYAKLGVASFERLFAKFIVTHFERLHSKFTIRRSASITLKGIFTVRQPGTSDLFADFTVKQWQEDLFADFTVKQWQEDLLAGFDVGQNSVSFKGLIIVRHPDSSTIFAQFISRQSDSGSFKILLIVRHPDSSTIFAQFISRQSDSRDAPFAKFVSRQSGSISIFGQFISRQSASTTLLTRLIVRHPGTLNRFAKMVIRHPGSGTIYAKMTIMQWGDIFTKMIVRHSETGIIPSEFRVRFPYRLWTSRRYLNGVISLDELATSDVILEYTIEGVMQDIKAWLDAQELSYVPFTDITQVPIAILRATTYGTIASLYARHSKTFRSRVITAVSPVNVTVKGDDQIAMEYWEKKMEGMLDLYLSAQDFQRFWVSTEDEEPIFSMADIPPTLTDETLWHEWLAQRGS